MSVTIPSRVKRIGDRAFSGCNNLRNVVTPKRFKEWQDVIFVNCSESLKITYSGK
jgi:hypothetical protein